MPIIELSLNKLFFSLIKKTCDINDIKFGKSRFDENSSNVHFSVPWERICRACSEGETATTEQENLNRIVASEQILSYE